MGTEDAVSGSGAGDGMGADFAEALRELKERSGLSYGVLAKRLHMSTSTLHRYCNGDAVPADYAPVERLARLCKATPEELVELHRAWVLADAMRRRKGSDSAGASGGAAGSAAAERGAASTKGEAFTKGAASEAGAGVASERSSASASGAGAGAGAVEAATAGAVVGHDGVSERRSAQSAVRRAVVGGAASDGSGGRSRAGRRSRSALVAGLAVAAVLGAVTLAVSLPSGGEEDGAGTRWAGDVSVGEEAAKGEDEGDRRSPSPSGASPSVSASTSGDKGEKGADKGSAPSARTTPSSPGGAGGGGGGEDASLPVPLSVKVEPYTWESPCSQRYLADRPPTKVGPPPPEQDAAGWVRAAGAVSSEKQFLTLTLQGTGEETVVVRSLKVRLVDKRSPLAWNDYAMGYPGVGCGAGVPTRSFTIALDAARPDVRPKAGSKNFPYSVSESDPEVYYVTADASAYYVSWYLELQWSSGSRSGTLRVNDNGLPFRTSGNNGRPAYEYPLGGPKWVPEGTTLGESDQQ